MPRIIALEDDARRIGAFRSAARSVLIGYELFVFVDAPEMINWLSKNLTASDILSLDRDLDATSVVDRNCGTGEDVIEFLIRQTFRPPVLIHSSNGLRAPAMHLERFAIGLPFGAWTGHRGLSSKGPWQNRVVHVGNLIGAYGSLISVVVLISFTLRALLQTR